MNSGGAAGRRTLVQLRQKLLDLDECDVFDRAFRSAILEVARLRSHHRPPVLLRHLEPPEKEGLGDLDVVQRLVLVAAGLRRRAAHREPPGRYLDERHARHRLGRRHEGRLKLFFGAHAELPEPAVYSTIPGSARLGLLAGKSLINDT
jgi:hypothetical protein